MRPDIAARQIYRLPDLLSDIPRSVFGFGAVCADIANAIVSWRTIFAALAAAILLVSADVGIREAIFPEFADKGGVFGLWIGAIIALPVIYAVLLALLRVSLMVVGLRPSWREIAIGFVVSELPQVAITAALLAAFAVAHGAGFEVGSGSTFNTLESTIAFGFWGFFLTWAISGVLGTSLGKAAVAVLLGPGWLMALLLWLSVGPG